MRRLRLAAARPAPRKVRARSRRPEAEALEGRLLLYAASGNAWPSRQLVTISFMPDGTNFAGKTTNLISKMNAMFPTTNWQNIILKAAQSWAAQTNLNFQLVSDNGAADGSGSYQQGDPGFGDIRIGGYGFGTSTLAQAFMPPPVNNYSVAGDIAFNTGQVFRVGSTYDLFTVAAHEIGHALGLYHSTVAAAEMYSSYNGVKNALNSDDIAGIQSIYGGARQPDAYNSGGAGNGTLATATDLSSLLDPTALSAAVTGLNLTAAGQKEYLAFTAPAGATGTLTVTVQSQGLSLLSPTAYILNPSGTVLASASGAGQYGTTLTLSVGGVVAGQQYDVEVTGADSTVFATGVYAITANFGGGAQPTVPLPNTTLANGSPLSSGGGVADSVDRFSARRGPDARHHGSHVHRVQHVRPAASRSIAALDRALGEFGRGRPAMVQGGGPGGGGAAMEALVPDGAADGGDGSTHRVGARGLRTG